MVRVRNVSGISSLQGKYDNFFGVVGNKVIPGHPWGETLINSMTREHHTVHNGRLFSRIDVAPQGYANLRLPRNTKKISSRMGIAMLSSVNLQYCGLLSEDVNDNELVPNQCSGFRAASSGGQCRDCRDRSDRACSELPRDSSTNWSTCAMVRTAQANRTPYVLFAFCDHSKRSPSPLNFFFQEA